MSEVWERIDDGESTGHDKVSLCVPRCLAGAVCTNLYEVNVWKTDVTTVDNERARVTVYLSEKFYKKS